MHARVTTLELDPERLDEAVAQLEEQDLPTFKAIDGFRGFTLMLDRKSGKVVTTSYWATQDHMQASEDAMQAHRDRIAEIGNASADPEIDRFEVALDSFVKQ
jgi:heme-degrading monooxygenase HmoA